MKYNSSKHKIRKTREKARKTSNKIDVEENTIQKIQNYTNSLQKPTHNWRLIHEYATEWTSLLQRDWFSTTQNYVDIELDLGKIPISFIPFIRFSMVFSPEVDLNNDVMWHLNAFQLEDTDNEDVKKVKLFVGIKLTHATNTQFFVKVTAQVYNPHLYI